MGLLFSYQWINFVLYYVSFKKTKKHWKVYTKCELHPRNSRVVFVGGAHEREVLSSTQAQWIQNTTFLLSSAEIKFLSGRDVGVRLDAGLGGDGQLPLGVF